MFTCSTCKNDWPENYCPQCAHTIDRSVGQPKLVDPPPMPVKSIPLRTNPKPTLSPKNANTPERNNCPTCGSPNTGKASFKYTAEVFQAYHNRCCYVCDTVWQPACPKWIASICIATGAVAALLVHLMGNDNLFEYGVGAIAPALYGFSVIFGVTGKMQVLSVEKSAEIKR